MTTKNKAIIMISAILSMAILAAQGCDLRSLVTVKAPKDVMEFADLPEGKMTLAEADQVWSDWEHMVTRNTNAFKDAIDDANVRYEKLNNLVSMGVTSLGDLSQGIPYGGLLFGALTGVTGLFLPQPKLKKRD